MGLLPGHFSNLFLICGPARLYWLQHTNNDPPESFVITGIKVNTNYEK